MIHIVFFFVFSPKKGVLIKKTMCMSYCVSLQLYTVNWAGVDQIGVNRDTRFSQSFTSRFTLVYLDFFSKISFFAQQQLRNKTVLRDSLCHREVGYLSGCLTGAPRVITIQRFPNPYVIEKQGIYMGVSRGPASYNIGWKCPKMFFYHFWG